MENKNRKLDNALELFLKKATRTEAEWLFVEMCGDDSAPIDLIFLFRHALDQSD